MSCLFPYKSCERINEKEKDMKKNLRNLNKQYRNDIKLLLLGTGDSGKSTFVRQMRIIYGDGYSEIERKSYISLIYANIFESMQNMIAAMERLEINYEKNGNAMINSELIMNIDYTNATLQEPFLNALKELWNDAGIQACYMRRNEFQLNDSTKYYITDIDRIAKNDYVPTDQDILRLRVHTTGVNQYAFTVNEVKFCIIDVGGQRSERRKWLHCFDNVKSIIFLTAISEYDQMLNESCVDNRLEESKTVFASILTYFPETPIILFFNKVDLLEEKIVYSDLHKYFPEFQGPPCDSNAACYFILQLFLQVPHKIYHHFTCATDTENIKVVFSAVKDIILRSNLEAYGLV